MKFHDLYWHDSCILDIKVNRKVSDNGGSDDKISFKIDWYDIGVKVIVFEGVRLIKVEVDLTADTSYIIMTADWGNKDDEDLERYYAGWKLSREEIKLNWYRIDLIGGRIKLLARDFQLTD